MNFQLSYLFTDHMILQRDKCIAVFGTGTDNTELDISLHNTDNSGILPLNTCLSPAFVVSSAASSVSVKTTIHNNSFLAFLPPCPAGGPYILKVSDGSDTVYFKDVLLGDLWLAGGQSNMEFELRRSDDYEALINEITEASSHPKLTTDTSEKFPDYEKIRYYFVPHIAYEDKDSENRYRSSKWQLCTAAAVPDWSAVALYFARRIQPEVNVPIGIIDCNWGGTSASAWMDKETLALDSDTNRYLQDYSKTTSGRTEEEYLAELDDYIAYSEIWEAKKTECYRQNPETDWAEILRLCGPCRWPGPMGFRNEFRPSGLYETMLQKCVPYTLKGVIYYQGESDEHHPDIYYKLFRSMIAVWRRDFMDESLPFLFVQLPMFKNRTDPDYDTWAVLREAQQKVCDTVENTGMAVILDLGKYNDIHPTEKLPVGERLALLALYQVYRKISDPLQVFGPMLSSCRPDKDHLDCFFYNAENGIYIGFRAVHYPAPDSGYLTEQRLLAEESPSEYIHGFEIAGADKIWHPAAAQGFYRDGEHGLCLTSSEVPVPLHARYAWINWAPVTVFGANGLPLAPFNC